MKSDEELECQNKRKGGELCRCLLLLLNVSSFHRDLNDRLRQRGDDQGQRAGKKGQ